MQLQWHQREDRTWHGLHEIDPEEIEGYGVFVIWRNGDPRRTPAVLYVGRGLLKHELAARRRDPLFRTAPGLHVTWAAVTAARDVEPIAAYLYQQLRPLWGEVVSPSTSNVPVNLPLSA